MLTLLGGKAITVTWVAAVLALFVLLGWPVTLATGSVLLLLAVTPPAIMLMLSAAPAPTLSQAIAEALRPGDSSRDRRRGIPKHLRLLI